MRARPEFDKRFTFVYHDLKSPIPDGLIDRSKVDTIYHLAAQSCVDFSIANPVECITNNILATVNMLEFARQCDNIKYIQNFSSDEVFGNANDGQAYKEDDRFDPRNPYSASKGGSDHICNAYVNTYRLPIITSHCVNALGQKQDIRKYCPKLIKMITNDEKVIIHAFPRLPKGWIPPIRPL